MILRKNRLLLLTKNGCRIFIGNGANSEIDFGKGKSSLYSITKFKM